MSFSAHRPGRFGSDGRIEFETDGERTEDLYLDDVRAQQAAGEPSDERVDADGPEDPYPVTRDLLEDALAMNPTQPVQVVAAPEAPVVAEEAEVAGTARIGEWGAVEEAAATAPLEADEPAAEEAAPTRPARAKRAKRRRERGSGWRRLAVLGGADASVLDQVPTETPRFVQMFFVIAGTALISAISMYFALTTGVRIVAWGALPLAIVWALIIFNLDRFLTSTMRSTHSVGRLIGLASPA